MESTIALVALIVSILAFLLSIIQYLRDNSHEKKVATLNAYNDIQEKALSVLSKYSTPMPDIEEDSEEWNKLSECLAALEWFAVGVNTGTYSIRITNRIGGSFLIHQYRQLEKVIDKKRNRNIVKGGHYEEYQLLVKHLERYKDCRDKLKRIVLKPITNLLKKTSRLVVKSE